MVVDYDDADLVKAIEQESHLNKLTQLRDYSKACWFFVNSKLK